jgi:hypothetical protein
VARVRKDLRNRSNVGGIVVNRQGTGSLSPSGDWNRSAAIDGRIGLGRYSHVAAFAAVTSTPGLSGDARAWEVSAQHNSTRWMLTGTFTDVGTNFNPEVGFLARNGGFRRAESLVFHRYRPANTLGCSRCARTCRTRATGTRWGGTSTGSCTSTATTSGRAGTSSTAA